MKILVFCQYFYPETFRVNEICEKLASQGNIITVITGIPNYPEGRYYDGYGLFNKRKEIYGGVKIIRVPIISRGHSKLRLALNYLSYAIMASIWALINGDTSYDVVCVYQLSPVTMAIPALLYKNKANKKLLLYCLDLWPESVKAFGIKEKTVLFRIIHKISRFIYQRCDKIAVTSEGFIDYLNQQNNVPLDTLEYLPQYAEEFFLNIAGRFKDNNCVDFVFAGNIGLVQDLDCIIKAVAEIRQIDHFKVHIIGDGSYLENAISLTKELGLSNLIVFHGRHPLEEMYDYYLLADAFLLTLKGDSVIGTTVPGKLQSYMAAGKPVLAAINGPASELITDVGCGECVKSGDYQGLAVLMRKFIENPDSYKEYGLKGRKYFETHFSINIFLNKLTHYFIEISK